MYWRAVGLLLSTSLLLGFGYLEIRASSEAKALPQAREFQKEPQGEELQPDAPTTPQNPSMFTRLVGPLTVWMKEAEAKREKAKAAEKAELEPEIPNQPTDHVDLSTPQASQHFLHRKFIVKEASAFTFSVPPHQAGPRLRGSFQSTAKDGSVDPPPADVDLVVMNEEEFAQFQLHRAGDVTFAADPSHNLSVNYAVPATHEQAQTYHLVFRNYSRKSALVDADFTLSFE